MVIRNDLITIQHDGAVIDPVSGYARIADAIFTRTGVFRYLNDDGSERMEYRPPEEVFHPEAIASMQGLPVYNDHPPVAVDSGNAALLQPTGSAANDIKKRGNNLVGSITLWDGKSIGEAKRGKTDLSMGYSTNVVEESGMSPEGIAFSHIQKDIRYNHLAQVDQGRAGTARFRLDHGEQVLPTEKGNKGMEELLDALRALGLTVEDRFDGKAVKVNGESYPLTNKDEAKKAIAAFSAWAKDQAKEAEEKGKGKKADDGAELATVKAERDSLKQKEDSRNSEEAKRTERERVDGIVTETIELRELAKSLKVDAIDGKTNEQLKIAICVADGADAKELEKKEPAYIAARFDIAKKAQSKKMDTVKDLREGDTKPEKKDDATDEDSDKARNDMIDKVSEQWKEKPEATTV